MTVTQAIWKPIIFNSFSINAILDSRKTQTRRVIKPQPIHLETKAPGGSWLWTNTQKKLDALVALWTARQFADFTHATVDTSPHAMWAGGNYRPAMNRMGGYQKGDMLWARETWATIPLYDVIKPSKLGRTVDLFWRADDSQTRHHKTSPGKWRPSIFMPRWASRLSLRVLDVKCERVQDISHNDSLAEGIDPQAEYNNYGTGSIYTDTFAELWDSINKKRNFGWSVNPWVFAITFEVVDK